MAKWCIWKERNARIFRVQRKDMEKVWNTMQDNLLSSIRCMQWHEQDKIFPREEVQIVENWGLNRPTLAALRYQDKLCLPSSPSIWTVPPPGVFKMNFDGASRGNLGPVGFGCLFHDHKGRIRMVFMGAIGQDTNKSAELEGLIQGSKVLIRGVFFRR